MATKKTTYKARGGDRNVRVLVSLSPEERQRCEAVAEARGLRLAAFLRTVALQVVTDFERADKAVER